MFCSLTAQPPSPAIGEVGTAVSSCAVSHPPAAPVIGIACLSPPPGFQLSSDYLPCHSQTLWIRKKSPLPGLRRSNHCSAFPSCTQGTVSVSPCLPSTVLATATPELPCPRRLFHTCAMAPCLGTSSVSALQPTFQPSGFIQSFLLQVTTASCQSPSLLQVMGLAFTCLTHC